MSQVRQIFKNTIALAAANLITRAGGLIMVLLISRMLHVTGLGIYSTALAYYGLVSLAGSMGSGDYLVREIAKNHSRTSRYVIHASVVATVVSAVIMVLFFIIVPHLAYSPELTAGMYVIILAILPGTLNTVQDAVFIAHQRVEFVMYVKFIATIVNISLSVFLLIKGYGVVGLLVVFVSVEYLVMVTFFYFINWHIDRLRWEFKVSFAIEIVREIKVFAALSILGALFAQPEIIILSLIQEEAQVGLYSSALKLAGFWYFIPQIFMKNVYPVLSRSYYIADQKAQMIQDKSIKYLLAISFPLTAGIIATAEPIINLCYGSGFENATLLLRILAWTLPLAFFHSVLWRVLIARGQQYAVLWVRIITLSARLGCGYFLITSLASLGAAITVPASLLLNALLLSFYIKRDGTKINFVHFSWRFALAATFMGVVTWAVRNQLSLWTLVPLGGVIYGSLVFGLRAISADDFALFRQVWHLKTVERN